MPFKNIAELSEAVRGFVAARDWEQFHSPRNLATALSVEAAEVLEHFQWMSEEQSQALAPEKRQEVAHELADVFIYLLRLAESLQVDLLQAAEQKLKINAAKYPVERSRGSIKKYTDY